MINGKPIKVLIVDDSQVSRDLLTHIYNSDPALSVVGAVCDGKEALDVIARTAPDVVSMDVEMPRMNGYESTRAIMESYPVPIVIVTSRLSRTNIDATFAAMEAGALAVVGKPHGPGHSEYDVMAARLCTTLKTMAEVKVVRRRPNPAAIAKAASANKAASVTATPIPRVVITKKAQVVVVGVSTGGPPVLHQILAKLPTDFALPIVIVQHITSGFLEGLCRWLQQSTDRPVSAAKNGDTPQRGHVYFAPDDCHLGFDSKGRFALSHKPPESGLRPSVGHLFRSAASVFGDKTVGVILTGMGRDGADELKLLRDCGALTIAQDKDSSVVHGMPGEAIALGAAQYVLAPDDIAAVLVNLAKIHPLEKR